MWFHHHLCIRQYGPKDFYNQTTSSPTPPSPNHTPHPKIWKGCEEDIRVACHSDRLWGGLLANLVIELEQLRSWWVDLMSRYWQDLEVNASFGSCPVQWILGIITPCNNLLVWVTTPMTNTEIVVLHARKETLLWLGRSTAHSVSSIFSSSWELLILDRACV